MSEDSTEQPLSIAESIRRRIAEEKLAKKSGSTMPELSAEERQAIDKFVQIARDAAKKMVTDIEQRGCSDEEQATN